MKESIKKKDSTYKEFEEELMSCHTTLIYCTVLNTTVQ